MVFSSSIFMLLFLPASLVLYYLMPGMKLKNFMLLVLSLVFYAAGEPVYIALMIIESLIGWGTALSINPFVKEKSRQVRLIMVLTIVLLLLPLLTFKYSGFMIENINALFSLSIKVPKLPLPLGISFYTFQIIGYVADVYRGKTEKAESNFFRFLLFVSMFAQMVQGPIIRYDDVEVQLKQRKFDFKQTADGITRFIAGCGKKVILSGEIGKIVTFIFEKGIDGKPVLMVWLGMLCYALQLYFDFSGYSDMALGLGKMFGFDYKENFDYPYLSRSITEFWRRWHISLGAFFRDYVYIPLGGNRRHQILNLAAVWFLTGLWHGSSWNFILWGIYFLLLLIIEKLVFRNKLQKVTVISNLLTIYLLLVGWTLFYFTDLNQVLEVLKAMHGLKGVPLWDPIYNSYFINNIAVIVACLIACMPLGRAVKRHMDIVYEKFPDMWFVMTFVYDFALLFICLSGIVGSGYNAFMYFQF